MEKLIQIDEQKLAEVLDEWFQTVDDKSEKFWTRNPVAKIIKTNLNNKRHWKRYSNSKRYSKRKAAPIWTPTKPEVKEVDPNNW